MSLNMVYTKKICHFMEVVQKCMYLAFEQACERERQTYEEGVLEEHRKTRVAVRRLADMIENAEV